MAAHLTDLNFDPIDMGQNHNCHECNLTLVCTHLLGPDLKYVFVKLMYCVHLTERNGLNHVNNVRGASCQAER